jgi:hypothetical protein
MRKRQRDDALVDGEGGSKGQQRRGSSLGSSRGLQDAAAAAAARQEAGLPDYTAAAAGDDDDDDGGLYDELPGQSNSHGQSQSHSQVTGSQQQQQEEEQDEQQHESPADEHEEQQQQQQQQSEDAEEDSEQYEEDEIEEEIEEIVEEDEDEDEERLSLSGHEEMDYEQVRFCACTTTGRRRFHGDGAEEQQEITPCACRPTHTMQQHTRVIEHVVCTSVFASAGQLRGSWRMGSSILHTFAAMCCMTCYNKTWLSFTWLLQEGDEEAACGDEDGDHEQQVEEGDEELLLLDTEEPEDSPAAGSGDAAGAPAAGAEEDVKAEPLGSAGDQSKPAGGAAGGGDAVSGGDGRSNQRHDAGPEPNGAAAGVGSSRARSRHGEHDSDRPVDKSSRRDRSRDRSRDRGGDRERRDKLRYLTRGDSGMRDNKQGSGFKSNSRGWARTGRDGGGGAAAAAAAAAQLVKRRAQAVELYSGVVALAMQPRKADLADSSMVRWWQQKQQRLNGLTGRLAAAAVEWLCNMHCECKRTCVDPHRANHLAAQCLARSFFCQWPRC